MKFSSTSFYWSNSDVVQARTSFTTVMQESEIVVTIQLSNQEGEITHQEFDLNSTRPTEPVSLHAPSSPIGLNGSLTYDQGLGIVTFTGFMVQADLFNVGSQHQMVVAIL